MFSALAAFTILWVKDPSEARMVFAIQYLSAIALLVSGIAFGYHRQITNYHAILIVYLAEGTAANSKHSYVPKVTVAYYLLQALLLL
jgi:hypothetical protein